MRRRYGPLLGSLFATVLTLAPLSAANGLESDRQKPVVAIADHSEYSEKLQRQILTGNVVVTQGSLKIRADKIVVYLNQGVLDRIDANGQPTHFEQLDDMEQLVIGQGNRTQYSAVAGQIVITGEAVLTNPTQSLRGERIRYNLNTQASVAEGGDERVSIIIQPEASGTQ